MGFHSRNSISVNCGLTYQSMWHTQQLRKPSFSPKQRVDLVMALCQEGCSFNIRAFNYLHIRTSCHRNLRNSSVSLHSQHHHTERTTWRAGLGPNTCSGVTQAIPVLWLRIWTLDHPLLKEFSLSDWRCAISGTQGTAGKTLVYAASQKIPTGCFKITSI